MILMYIAKRFVPLPQILSFLIAAVILAWGCTARNNGSFHIGRDPSWFPQNFGGKTVPGPRYYTGMNELYRGDYRRAAREFESGLRGAIKTTQSRWIDSICYYTMLGESYYHIGEYSQALTQYDAALNLYLQFSDWMIRVKFPPTLEIDQTLARRATPWGRSSRGILPGRFPRSMLIGQGRINNEMQARFGGVIQQATLFPVNVQEIVGATALAIRRRTEIMGPVAPVSKLTGELVTALSRRPGPPNHWSEAWIDLLIGLAQESAGKPDQAVQYLQRSLVANGQFDHPLSSVGRLALGRIAADAGDWDTAAMMFEEAVYSAYLYDNLGVVTEALRYGQQVHLAANREGVFPPLAVGIAWAKKERYRHIQAWLDVLAAENYTSLGQTQAALNAIKDGRSALRQRGMSEGIVGARIDYLTAMTGYQLRQPQQADSALTAALGRWQSASKRLFQISLVDYYYAHPDGPGISSRNAIELYGNVLRDATASDWLSDPLETLTVLTTPHGEAYDNWFAAAVDRGPVDKTVEIADRARRHRFSSTLPLGGRLLSLRWVLQSQVDGLPPAAAMARQDLLVRYPDYDTLAQQATNARFELARGRLLPEDADARRKKVVKMDELAELSTAREAILREIALSRQPSEVVFPPFRSFQDLQTRLPEGHAMLIFFATAGDLYGFVITGNDYTRWKVESPVELRKNIVALLQSLGNRDANREVVASTLSGESWKDAARKTYESLFAGSKVDLSNREVEHLVIVPDDVLWYLPFEVLIAGNDKQAEPLVANMRIRYAPTASLAIADERPRSQTSTTGIVLGKLFPRDDDKVAAAAFERLRGVVPGALKIQGPIGVPSPVFGSLIDGLIVLDDVEVTAPYNWSPIAVDRNRNEGTLYEWFSLPWGSPDWMVFPGFHTAAETSLRQRGREFNGNEVFLAVCGLMSGGTQTVLLSRWRTGGQTSVELVREFSQELPHMLSADAWQRSVQLAMSRTIDAEQEPRVKRSAKDLSPTPMHPFFWAGYMLIDSGREPHQADEPDDK